MNRRPTPIFRALSLAAFQLVVLRAVADDAPAPATTGSSPVFPRSVEDFGPRPDPTILERTVDSLPIDRMWLADRFPSYFTKEFWDPWEGNVELGLNGTDGNSRTFNTRFGVTAKHKTDWLVRSMQLTINRGQANGREVANTALLDGRLDWPMPEVKWNYFVHALNEYDQFRAYNTRLSADAGVGYEFHQTDLRTLIGRIGPAVSREVGGPDARFKPELAMGVEFKRKLDDRNQLNFTSSLYPRVTDFDDFRANSQASWQVVLSQDLGLSLRSSILHRYDSTPFGRKPGDLNYATLLLWAY